MPQKAEYPKEVRDLFQGHPRIPLKDITLLDFKGCELLIASEGPSTVAAGPYQLAICQAEPFSQPLGFCRIIRNE
jgi:hypothetical protein